MSRSKKLAARINSFNERVISLVEGCTEEDWQKLGSEQWPVGVTARHIGANHYHPALLAARKILKGEKLPDVTMEQVTENANRHAREHAQCTKPEVLDILRNEGRNIAEFLNDLEDWELDKKCYLPALGSKLSLEHFLENILLRSAGEHFESMKAATGSKSDVGDENRSGRPRT